MRELNILSGGLPVKTISSVLSRGGLYQKKFSFQLRGIVLLKRTYSNYIEGPRLQPPVSHNFGNLRDAN